MKTKFILLALLATTCFSACKKDKPEPADPLANAYELLQNKNWKLTALTVSPAYYGITNALQYWDPCDVDDLYRFNAADQFVLNSGATLCYPDEEQEQFGIWNYNEISHLLSFQLQPVGDYYSLKLIEISEATMKGQDTMVEDGVTYTATWVFTKQ